MKLSLMTLKEGSKFLSTKVKILAAWTLEIIEESLSSPHLINVLSQSYGPCWRCGGPITVLLSKFKVQRRPVVSSLMPHHARRFGHTEKSWKALLCDLFR